MNRIAEVVMLGLKNILVATDFGAASDAALACARKVARASGATLHVLHVVDDVYARGLEAEPLDMWAEEQRELTQSAADSLTRRVTREDVERFNERVSTVVSANAAEAIVEFARDARADLLVMGTHGRKAIDPVDIGGVSARVVHAAPCPVLTVKAISQTRSPAAVGESVAER